MNAIDLAAAVWCKSSFSNGQANCVEVARDLPHVVAVRDSKDADGVKLIFSSTEWRSFVRAVRDGSAS